MLWSKVGAAVVIVAHQFNPSVVTQLWLARTLGMQDEDFLPDCLFSDKIVQVRSRQFHMLIVAEQLQFVPTEVNEQSIICEKLGTIVKTLPFIPYRAVGLNFNWHLIPEGRSIAETSRELFYREDRPLFQHFQDAESHFGAYLSKDVEGFRLKLDVKPGLVGLADSRTEHRIQFAFNFHCDLGDNPTTQLQDCLSHWDKVKHEAQVIIDSVEKRDQS